MRSPFDRELLQESGAETNAAANRCGRASATRIGEQAKTGNEAAAAFESDLARCSDTGRAWVRRRAPAGDGRDLRCKRSPIREETRHVPEPSGWSKGSSWALPRAPPTRSCATDNP